MNDQKKHKYITDFQPQIEIIKSNCNLPFSAGKEYEYNFNTFLPNDVEDYLDNGDGVTYLVKDGDNVVAYFVLSSNAIPFEYICEGESEIWGIPVVEVKMFAVNDIYQDVFFKYNEEEMPIAAWCIRFIIFTAEDMIGCKAICLHSVPEAEEFYKKNGFIDPIDIMKPFNSIDQDMRMLWLPLKEINFGDGYEE